MTKTSPLVSVLVNNHNYGRFLPEALDSALGQTYERLEVVVVDDGSTDDSIDVIEAYAKRDARIVPVLKKNGGQASAYNAGVEAARGDVLCFLDSDDTWFPEKVATIVAAHERHPHVQHDLMRQSRSMLAVPADRFDMQRLLMRYGHSCCMPSSALSITSDLARRMFPIPEDGLRLCADAFVARVATYFAGVSTIEHPLGTYRVHDGNRFFRQNMTREQERHVLFFDALEVVNRWLFEHGHYPIPHPNAVLRDRMLVDVLGIEPGGTYLVYGTGSNADRIVDLIDRQGGLIRAFIDPFEEKWTQTKAGKPIIGPGQIAAVAEPHDRLIVASMHLVDILKMLRQHDVSWSQVRYPPYFLRGDTAPVRPPAASGTAPQHEKHYQAGKLVVGRDEVTHYFLEHYPATSVLDIGCGTGPVWDLFAAKGLHITGVDLLPTELVPSMVGGSPVTYHSADFLSATLPQQFDAVYSSHTIEHVPDTERFLRAFFAHLAPDGAYCLMWPPPKPEIVSGHVHVFNPGLMLYNLVRLGIDCRDVEVVRCGYSLAIMGRYRRFERPELTHNEGDLNALAEHFPFRAQQDFNGDRLPGMRDIPIRSGALFGACV